MGTIKQNLEGIEVKNRVAKMITKEKKTMTQICREYFLEYCGKQMGDLPFRDVNKTRALICKKINELAQKGIIKKVKEETCNNALKKTLYWK